MSLLLLLLVPLGGSALMAVVGGRRDVAARVAVSALAATAALAFWLAGAPDPPSVEWTWREGMGLRLGLEGFGRVMAVLVPLIAAPVAAFASAGEGEEGAPRLLAWILGFVGAMELLVLATEFLTLLVGWELVGACSWALIGYRWRDAERPAAATRAFLTTRFGDLGLYLAAAAVFDATGSLEFTALRATGGVHLPIVGGGVLVAAAAKSAQLPFSPWLFSAMSGPTPASALLHSATMVAAGAYALIRLMPWLEPVPWFSPAVVGVGVTTAVAGGVVAATQPDIKKALAASTSSQYGLMFVAVGVGSATAASVHLVAHAAFKSLLFLVAGVAIHAAGTGDLKDLRLGSALPRTAVLMGVGALSLAAVPPLGGAYSKEAVLAAAVHASGWLGMVVLASGGLTAFYAVRLLLLSYGPGDVRQVTGPRPAETGALLTLSGLAVLLGLLWLPGVAEAAGALLPGEGFVEAAAWEMPVSLTLIALAGGACVLLWRQGSLFTLGLPAPLREFLSDWLGLPAATGSGLARPILALAAGLARFDDRIVDGGVRATATIASRTSNLLARWGEWGADGTVEAVALAALRGAHRSRIWDDRGVDGAVEGAARITGAAGSRLRSLQTGLTHHYYTAAAVGLLVLVGVAILWR